MAKKKMDKNNENLEALEIRKIGEILPEVIVNQKKPNLSVEQVAWVFECICQNWNEEGTFRNLIYDIMGFDGDAYKPLYLAGGMRIINKDKFCE